MAPVVIFVKFDTFVEDEVEVDDVLLGRLLLLADEMELFGAEEVDDDAFVVVAEESSLSS